MMKTKIQNKFKKIHKILKKQKINKRKMQIRQKKKTMKIKIMRNRLLNNYKMMTMKHL